jgi:hypothetical protein
MLQVTQSKYMVAFPVLRLAISALIGYITAIDGCNNRKLTRLESICKQMVCEGRWKGCAGMIISGKCEQEKD